MHPILLTTAASAAGDIIHSFAEKFASGPAKTAASNTPEVPFSTLIDKATAPTASNPVRRMQDLRARLERSVEVVMAGNEAGATAPLQVQIDSNGDAALRLPDGSLKSIQLSGEMRGVARELHQLAQTGAACAPTAAFGSSITISLG